MYSCGSRTPLWTVVHIEQYTQRFSYVSENKRRLVISAVATGSELEKPIMFFFFVIFANGGVIYSMLKALLICIYSENISRHLVFSFAFVLGILSFIE